MRRRFWRVAQLLIAALGATTLLINAGAAPAASGGAEFVVGGWQLVEYIQGQPACTGVGYDKQLFKRSDCGFGRVFVTPAVAGKQVKVDFIDRDGTVVDTQTVTTSSSPLGRAQFNIFPDQNWDPGEITVRATVAAPDTGTGEARIACGLRAQPKANPVSGKPPTAIISSTTCSRSWRGTRSST
jgi:hypothetical protein